jgi:uncharacterized membrane protein YtjA (UPF0391 family)
MPDDKYHPTHGLPPDSRPTNVPPEWWSQLDRKDLPEGGGEPGDRRPRWRRRTHDFPDALPATRPGLRWHHWAANIALIVIAVLLLTAGLGGTAPNGIAPVLFLLGILTLVALVAVQVAGGTGHRR